MEQNPSKTVIIPIDAQSYEQIVYNRKDFQKYLDNTIECYPELFPSLIKEGYILKGWTKPCKKIAIKRRLILLKSTEKELLIHPCFVLPYLKGNTKEVSKGLLMRKYNVPYHAIASSFGRDAMYWYRLELSLALNSIVGTTIKDLNKMPKHILVDEHHDKLLGDKVYVCTTVAKDCFLGAALSANMTFEALEKAYGVFKAESNFLQPCYSPLTINLDGFHSTTKAMKSLFPSATAIKCFLHGYLKIRDNASKRYDDYFEHIANKVWHCYKAKDKRSFAQRLRRLEEWTNDFVPDSSFKKAILKLCQKKRLLQILPFYSKSKNVKYAG